MFTEADFRRAHAAYAALPEYASRARQIHDRPGAPPSDLDLTAFELQVFSQNGEDGVLAEILRRIGVTQRWFVEFGVESGREGVCVALADVLGWNGMMMEADDVFHHLLAQK
ncbi:MAG: hypothetical protein ACRDQH_11635, partial [Pseudonocardiaceae bacterium]